MENFNIIPIGETLRNFVLSIERHFCKSGIFPVSSDKLVVYDVSAAGVSVLLQDKKYLRLFKTGSTICSYLTLPGKVKVHFQGKVQYSILSEFGIIKVGIQIEVMDDDDREIYNRYLLSLDEKKNKNL